MEWFIKAAEPFKGMEIKVVSETIPTHEYESKVLTKAFEEITGIKVTHDLIQEGDVIEKLQTQMQSGKNVFDAYINDSDLIGTHFRYGHVVNLTDWMAGEGKDVTLPTWTWTTSWANPSPPVPTASSISCPTSSSPICTGSATTGSTGMISKKVQEIYGYELGVPVNWSAYEDIAEFFQRSTSRRSTARPSTATWTTARKPRTWAGGSPMPGSPWPAPATRDAQRQARGRMGHPGGRTAARWAPVSAAAVPPTARPPNTPCASTWNG
jgi:hypothetical protein